MSNNLKVKAAGIIAVLVVFCYGFLGIPHGVTSAALKQAIADRINLGLDLKGGIHLVLQVHVADAINSSTDSDMQRLQDDLGKAGVTGEKVVKLDPANHPETITISGIPLAKSSDARTVLDGLDYSNYALSTNSDGSWKLEMKPSAVKDLESRTIANTCETIYDRIDQLGNHQPTVQPYGLGDNEILVELPGISDPSRVEDIIQSTARLEIHAVVGNGRGYDTDDAALQALGGSIPPDQELVRGVGSAGAPVQSWVLERASVVEGTDFRDAQPSTDVNGRPDIHFTLTTAAGEVFYKYTSTHSKDSSTPGSMAIVLDNQVREVATIDSGIRDSGEITGGFTKQQADDLGMLLRTGSLPAGISYLDTTAVGPSLGAESIHQGVVAAIVGMLAVMVFMLIYYRAAGINADLALLLNLIFLLGFMGFTGSTLTLP